MNILISDAAGIATGLITLQPERAAVYAIDLARIPALYARSQFNERRFKKEREDSPVDSKTGLKKKTKDFSVKEDMKRCNPPGFGVTEGASNNCMLCTTAYDLRRRGYDVAAQVTANGYTTNTLKEWYPKIKISKEYDVSNRSLKNIKQRNETINSVKNELLSQGEGARGNFMVSWHDGGGHSMGYEIENGKVKIRECQGNKTFSMDSLSGKNLLSNVDSIQYARTDNVDFNPKNMREIMR